MPSEKSNSTIYFVFKEEDTFVLYMDDIEISLKRRPGNKSYLITRQLINTFNDNSNGQMQLSLIHLHMLWNT